MQTITGLNAGSTIGVCAPCARFDVSRLDKGISVLENMGFKVWVPDDIYLKDRYFAGTDQLRADVFNRLIQNDSIDAIMAARGGYGSLRILEYLDWELIKKKPKPFIGFSDCTALHSAIHEKTGNVTIHGPNLVSLAEAAQETLDSLYNILTSPFSPPEIFVDQVIIEGHCTGILKGGNLATLASMIGTAYTPDFEGTIFFFEDINEPAYKIDRMLIQMKMAGLFNGLAGVVAGSFKTCDNDDYIPGILVDIFSDYGIPVFTGMDCGHGSKNLSLMLGQPAAIDSTRLQLTWTT